MSAAHIVRSQNNFLLDNEELTLFFIHTTTLSHRQINIYHLWVLKPLLSSKSPCFFGPFSFLYILSFVSAFHCVRAPPHRPSFELLTGCLSIHRKFGSKSQEMHKLTPEDDWDHQAQLRGLIKIWGRRRRGSEDACQGLVRKS